MIWHGIAWTEAVKKYREQFGNLLVPKKYVDDAGFALGHWIINMRRSYIDGRLSQKHIQELNELGMSWNAFDAKWEQGYGLAVEYAAENGNLNVPVSYVTLEGQKLGLWLCNQRAAYLNGKLSSDQISRLETIGMYWGNRNDRQWNEVYQAAKRYFEANGNLDVPVSYVSPKDMLSESGSGGSSMPIRSRKKQCSLCHRSVLRCWMPSECSGRNLTPWQHRYELAQEYKKSMEIWIFR